MNQTIASRLKSEGERKIAAALTHYGIPFTYEPKLAVQDGTRRRVFRPDFYLPQRNVYIEYFGRAGNDSYDQRSSEKMRLYESNGHAVAPLYPWDLCANWPSGLLDHIDHAERQSNQQRPVYGSRNPISYGVKNGTRSWRADGNDRYRR